MWNCTTLNVAAFLFITLAGTTHGQDVAEMESTEISQTSDEVAQVPRQTVVQQRGPGGIRWERVVGQAVFLLLMLITYWCNRNQKDNQQNSDAELFYAVRRSDDWKWRGRHTAEQLLTRISNEDMHEDWLVAPFASNETAVTARAFAENPSVFVARLRARKENQKTVADQRRTK